MTVDEQGVGGGGLRRFQFDYEVLYVPVVVREPVDEVEAEGAAGLLDVGRQLVDGTGIFPDGLHLPLEVLHGQDLVFVTSCRAKAPQLYQLIQ